MAADTTWYLVDGGRAMPAWCEMAVLPDGRIEWIDFKARRIPSSEARLLAVAAGPNFRAARAGVPEAVNSLERGFAYERLLDPWSRQGWLAPNGRFYGCAFYQHDDIAYSLLGKSPAALEDRGWIRVHESSFRLGSMREMTDRQYKTLLALGFTDPDSNPLARSSWDADRSQEPPRFAVTPPGGAAWPVPVQEPARDPAGGLKALSARLAASAELDGLFDADPEEIEEVGPGAWEWMLRWDGFDLGSEEGASNLSRSEGLSLWVVAPGQVEVSSDPQPGVRISAEAAEVMFRCLRRMVA